MTFIQHRGAVRTVPERAIYELIVAPAIADLQHDSGAATGLAAQGLSVLVAAGRSVRGSDRGPPRAADRRARR